MVLVNAALDVEADPLVVGPLECGHLVHVVLVDEALYKKNGFHQQQFT